MSNLNEMSGIADASKPNAGRVYDALLGGNHNFEVDRIVAQKILTAAPVFGKVCRLLRWYLGEAVRRLVDEGFTNFIDFASGLPSSDHIHSIAGPRARVVYSDIDPVTVAYGQEIVKGLPNVRYVHCNAATPEELLDSPVIEEMFGDERKVVFGINAVAFFLKDPDLGHIFEALYDWAAPGSKLFISDADDGTRTEGGNTILKLYAEMNQKPNPRTMTTLKGLIGKWKPTDGSFQPLEQWVDMPSSIAGEIESDTGIRNLYGAIFVK